MAGRLSPQVGLRLDPDVFAALKAASEAESRSMSAQAGVIVRQWLQSNGHWTPPARAAIPASYRLEPAMLQRVMEGWVTRQDVLKAAGYDVGVEELMTRHAKEANPPCVVLRRNTKSRAKNAPSSYHLRQVAPGEVPGQLILD